MSNLVSTVFAVSKTCERCGVSKPETEFARTVGTTLRQWP